MKDNLRWLEQKYGVDASILDDETRRFACGLKFEGVRRLVEANWGRKVFRGTRINSDEAVNLLYQMEAIVGTSRDVKWAKGQGCGIGDRPADWVDDEVEMLVSSYM